GGMADHGQPLHGYGSVLRRRQSRRASPGSRFQRPEARLRLRRPAPWTVRDPAAHRSGAEHGRHEAGCFDDPDFLRLPVMSTTSFVFGARRSCRLALLIAALGLTARAVSSQSPHFFPDDPISREPESQDASNAQPYFMGSMYEMTNNLFVTAGYRPSGTRAQNINTIDEVPDSNWFTNRIGATMVSADEIARGPNRGDPPDPSRWILTKEKTSGSHPGFTARDAKGETWFLEFDPAYFAEGATGAVAVATKIFWALGYNQVETYLTTFDPANVTIDPEATLRRPSGAR